MRSNSLTPLRLELEHSRLTPLTSTLSTTLAIVSVILVGVGGLGVWAGTAKIARGGVAEGSIVVESTRKTIQHLEGGIVSKIPVKDGDYVQQGQELVRLSDARAILTYAIMQDKFDQDIALAARLRAEREDRETIGFDQDLLDRAKMNPATADIIEAQKQQFEARRKSEQGKTALLQEKIEQLKQQSIGLEAQVASKLVQFDLIGDELKGAQGLYAKGLEPKTKVLALQRASQDLIGSRAETQAQIAADKIAIEETEMQMLQNQRMFHEDVVEKLREVNADQMEVSDRMASLKESMDRLVVRSPIDGQVVGSAVHTVGGVIAPGEKLMDIVPNADQLVVEARIPPSEVHNLSVGLPVEVRLTALRQRTTPTLNGVLTTLSTDVLADQGARQPYYSARVEIPPAELSRLGQEKLIAGMPAEVLVKNGERTVLNYLFAPITDSIFRSFRQD